MIPLFYLLYLTLVIFFTFFYGKIPKVYQVFVLIILSILLTSINNISTLTSIFSEFQSGKIGLPELMVDISMLYVNAWKTWDSHLANAISVYSSNKVRGMLGIILFLGMDILYLLALALLIYWFIGLFKGCIYYFKKFSLDKEHEKELELFLSILSLVIAFYIGYQLVGFDGLIKLFNLCLSSLNNFHISFPVNNTTIS